MLRAAFVLLNEELRVLVPQAVVHATSCSLIVDRVRMPPDPGAPIRSLLDEAKRRRTTKAVVSATRFGSPYEAR